MSVEFIYISAGFSIYPHQHLIKKEANSIQVRPKTFALLLLLLENPREVLSKRFLIETIWDDVTVDEPVLVQSIREIRQLFGDADIIQTYPRKGYAWTADVKKQPVDEQQTLIESFTANATQNIPVPVPTQKTHTRIALSLAATIAGIVFLLFWFYSNRSTQQQNTDSQTQVVVILPVKNTIMGNDHSWVYWGAMDELISSLTSSSDVQVMNVEYVMSLLPFAKISKDYSSEDARRIFGVSGATLVVESKVSGSIAEYQLEYSLHFKQDIKRGVILDKNLHEALHKLSLVIAGYTGQSLSAPASQNAFMNELMARALERLIAEDFEAARTFLVTLKQLSPDDLTVRELLVRSLVKSQASAAREEAQAAFDLAKAQNKPEPASIHTYLAMANFTVGDADNALSQLDASDQLASQNADIHFQAYNAQMRGFILQQKGNLSLAEDAYKSALKFYSIIRCPIGLTVTHIDMSKLFAAQGKQSLANEHIVQAQTLIAEHKLDALAEMLAPDEVEKNKNSHADQRFNNF